MEYVSWALYCYIVIQLINDGRKQAKSEKQGSEPRGAHYYQNLARKLHPTTVGCEMNCLG